MSKNRKFVHIVLFIFLITGCGYSRQADTPSSKTFSEDSVLERMPEILNDRIETYRKTDQDEWIPWMKEMKKKLLKTKVDTLEELPKSEQIGLLYLYHDYRIAHEKAKKSPDEEVMREQKIKKRFTTLILNIERILGDLKKEFAIDLRKSTDEGYGAIYKEAKKREEKLVKKTFHSVSRKNILKKLNHLENKSSKEKKELRKFELLSNLISELEKLKKVGENSEIKMRVVN